MSTTRIARLNEINKEDENLLNKQSEILSQLITLRKERTEIIAQLSTELNDVSPSNAAAEAPSSTKTISSNVEQKTVADEESQKAEKIRKKQVKQDAELKRLKEKQEKSEAKQEAIRLQKIADEKERKEAKKKLKLKIHGEYQKKVEEELQKRKDAFIAEFLKNNKNHQSNDEDQKKEKENQEAIAAARLKELRTKELERLKREKDELQSKKESREDRKIKTQSMILTAPIHLGGTNLNERTPSNPSDSPTDSVCPNCQKPILRSQATIKACSSSWHRSCFRCVVPNCTKFISTVNFTEIDSKPYCKDHGAEEKKKQSGAATVALSPTPASQPSSISPNSPQSITSPPTLSVTLSVPPHDVTPIPAPSPVETHKERETDSTTLPKCSKCSKELEEGMSMTINNIIYCQEHYEQAIQDLVKIQSAQPSSPSVNSPQSNASPTSGSEDNTPSSKPSPAEDNKPSSLVRQFFAARKNSSPASSTAGSADPSDKTVAERKNSSPGSSSSPESSGAMVSGMPHWGTQSAGSVSTTKGSKSVIVRGTSSAASRFASQNQEKCDVCGKTVYAVDKIAAEGKIFHKPCLRCTQCGKVLKLGNYAGLDGVFYCKPHFKQLFMSKGNYSEGFGKQKLTAEWAEKNGKEVTPIII